MVKKNPLEELFSRGNDSILNRDSSAERRLLEGVLLVKLAEAGGQLVGIELAVKAKFDLKASTTLPLSVESIGDKFEGLSPAAKGALIGTGIFPGVGTVAGGTIGAIAGAVGGGTKSKLNPGQPTTENTVGLQMSGEVPLADVLIAALMAGYLIEKANVDIGEIARGLGEGLGGLKETVGGAVGAAAGAATP